MALSVASTVDLAEFPCFRRFLISSTHIQSFAIDPRNKPSWRRGLSLGPSPPFFRLNHRRRGLFEPESCSDRPVLARVAGEDALDATGTGSGASAAGTSVSSSAFGDGYVALFVRMLGLDNDPLDREQAAQALWKYSLGGKKCVDAIMQFHGCLNLTVNLLKSESSATCEAAAGLLRELSSVNLYRESVAESGALEEIAALLSRPSLSAEIKEQSLCTLWNLSVDVKLRDKIADFDILRLIVSFLEDDDIKVRESAGGVLANLALSCSNHKTMVEAGVIPKLANLLKGDSDNKGSKVMRQEARNTLLELAKDEYWRLLIIEEGLVPVPLIGAAAYKSFRPPLYSWPSLPDGVEIEQTPKRPSRSGAPEVLLGLNIDKNIDIEEAKIKAIVGRTNQQFLARVGAIELENGTKSESPEKLQPLTLLPYVDGVARLVLILGLDDKVAVSRAADSIADASINEHMRVSFKEAGAVEPLVQLLVHDHEAVKSSVIRALKKLSLSRTVCRKIEVEGAVPYLLNLLKQTVIPQSVTEQILDILAHLLDPSKEMKSKFYEGPVNRSSETLNAARHHGDVSLLSTSKGDSRDDVLNTTIISRLVQIAKTASPNLLRKVISIIEFGTVTNPNMNSIISVDITSALKAAFKQKVLEDNEKEAEEQGKHALELEEAGLTISAASRLLTKLLDSESFRQETDAAHFVNLLRKILRSSLPLHHKEWVAASLVKLSSARDLENPIHVEVTLYETIPRLVEQMSVSVSPEVKEAAVVELNRIVSEGVEDSARVLAARGGIEPLVKLLEDGNERAVEASLSVLYNLSMDCENHAAIIGAGAVPRLRRIVLSERPQWKRALRLLRNLPI
ncbi:PREDICTED: uncharacterized protein LOC104822169 isoform X2 [Tarenaya hassleriana]|uniref:uncharacterized protein LOC104822169 isoform X2 n=1 Tax=Tarenaya hassleriana TaxID=28532 RepID=UPI00053C5FBB|nr:PREDICTED: uncharacterized protein LOC104822169 isoform X2 [Tarenaya hassleriana]